MKLTGAGLGCNYIQWPKGKLNYLSKIIKCSKLNMLLKLIIVAEKGIRASLSIKAEQPPKLKVLF